MHVPISHPDEYIVPVMMPIIGQVVEARILYMGYSRVDPDQALNDFIILGNRTAWVDCGPRVGKFDLSSVERPDDFYEQLGYVIPLRRRVAS